MDDPAVFELAGRWLSSCITKSSGHKNCYHSTIVKFHPRRLLDIRGESVILSLKTQRATYEPYCALSYCWGEEPTQLILTQSNEKELCQGIDINTLPETIQDAICVTKKLGINYIWIDRLCIIQRGDEGHDWMKHSSEMSSIYSHCILNLSVDRAKSAIEGFLGPRNWPPLQPIFIKRQLNEDLSVFSKKCVITFRNVTDIALVTEPLGSRAWILSERVLSPRTLHFGAGEMFWECTGCHIASESCPYGFSTVLENFAYANYSLTHSNSDRKRFEDWIGILTNYSRLSLSHPSADKLVALAGVARFYEETTGNNLVAGILKSTLPMSLLWERNQVTKATRSSTYRAPSWSWASMDGALNFYQSRDPFGFSRDVAEVRDVWVKPVDEDNNLGQLEDGAITIYGPAMFLEDFDRVAPEFPKLGRRFHTYWDEPQHEELKETVLVLFLSIFTGADSDSDIVHAILLTPSKKKEMWVRVGVSALYFARGEKSEASENSKSREFLEKRDLRTVTIV